VAMSHEKRDLVELSGFGTGMICATIKPTRKIVRLRRRPFRARFLSFANNRKAATT
jgi:hypothetical protein